MIKRELVLVISVSILTGVFFGLNYGTSNQNTYFVHGLRLYDSHLLANDWLASKTTDVHPYFSYLVALFISVDRTGWIFAIANVLAVAAAGLILYSILGVVAQPSLRFPAFLTLMGLISVFKTPSLGYSSIFSEIFQPSTIGALGYLAAMLLFLKTRYLASGFALAVGGLFHANFLVLAFPFFFLAHAFLGKESLLRRLIRQFIPLVIPLALLAPLMLETASAQGAETARTIMETIRAPFHYVTLQFLEDFVPFLGWLFLGYSLGWELLSTSPGARSFKALVYAILILLGVASLLTTAVYISVIAQAYVWRLAPFLVLMFQILASVGLVHFVIGRADASGPKVKPVPMYLGIGLIAAHYVYKASFPLNVVIAVIVLAALVAVRKIYSSGAVFVGRRPEKAVVAFWVGCAVVASVMLTRKVSLITGLPPEETSLIAWAHGTPAGSVFLVPPDLENFRFHSERAIIVDWKSGAFKPDDVLEWYKRIATVSGIESPRSADEVSKGYDMLDGNRLNALYRKYPFDFVVVRKPGRVLDSAVAGEVYHNREFTVFKFNLAEKL